MNVGCVLRKELQKRPVPQHRGIGGVEDAHRNAETIKTFGHRSQQSQSLGLPCLPRDRVVGRVHSTISASSSASN